MDIDNKIFVPVFIVTTILGMALAYKMVFHKATLPPSSVSGSPTPHAQQVTITSSAFENEGIIPVTFTCNGENKSPPLAIGNVPVNTKTLALIVEDPDAPLGAFVHWIVWDILPETKVILAGSLPSKAQVGTNSFNHTHYDGPCPPSRHRYFFTVYALDETIGLDGKAKKSDLEKAMAGHVIEQVHLIGLYGN